MRTPGSAKTLGEAQRLQAIKTHPQVHSAEELSSVCCGFSLLQRWRQKHGIGQPDSTAHKNKALGPELPGIKEGRHSPV